MECHGNTLLPQFLGMYRLTVDGMETYMVVTRNVFSHRLTVHRKYDLKVTPWWCLGGILTSVFVHIIAADSFSLELMSESGY